MLGCLGDENVDVVILKRLRAQGFDVTWIAERGLQELPDPQVLALCLMERRVLLTTDRDHLGLSADAARSRQPCAPVIFWPQGKRNSRDVSDRIIRLISRDDYESLLGQVMFV